MLVQRHAGPSLLALTITYLVMFIASASKVSVAFHVPHVSEAAVAFVAQNNGAIRWGSFFELASAIPLGIFMAASVSRLRFLRIRAAGVQIAALGGIATPMMLAGSALATWSLTRPGVAAAPGAVEALQSIGFDGGGPGFAVFLGLFLAGVSVSAGISKLIPRWLMWLGIVVAAAGELSSFTLVNFTAGYFIPVARFLSILWMFGIALKLPATHPLRETDDLGPAGGAKTLTGTPREFDQP
ncbi:MAG TPA: hypothetical protein VGN16_14880 [Acidobacteriaceae bacterium]